MVSSSKNDTISWQPWKRENKSYSAEKLVIPLPVPHPAHIAITIHNRDSDDPINLHSELCNNILKALEDSQIVTGAVARYRGGTTDESTESRDSSESLSPDEEVAQPPQNLTWNISRRRSNSGSVRVDLASPEDISLDTDSSRVVFSQYGTTV